MAAKPAKVAIVGGGCGGLSAAWELSRPELNGRFEVTVYQMGWRLGGKGASSRGQNGRIEEHGLHLWLGFYENAFRHMRECYAELQRDPSTCSIASFEQAFFPDPRVSVTEQDDFGDWDIWSVDFPIGNGQPGSAFAESNPFAPVNYLSRAFGLMSEVLRSLGAGLPPDPQSDTAHWVAQAEQVLMVSQMTGLVGIAAGLQICSGLLAAGGIGNESTLAKLIERIQAAVRQQIEMLSLSDKRLRRLWSLLDLVLASTRGVFRFGLLTDPRGFDAIDDYDLCDWLAYNGAHANTVNSPFLRAALYDLTFAFAQGDATKPSFSAAVGLRCAVRSFMTYRGAMFYKMGAGMGDIVFAPLYEVLAKRGVRFEFFHRLSDVDIAQDTSGQHVNALQFDIQAEPIAAYDPLVEVQGLPVWPAEPRFEQLKNGAALRDTGIAFESESESHRVTEKRLTVGQDFDFVVLALSMGSIPRTCSKILASEPKWQLMVDHVTTIGTQAAQLWLRPTTLELGHTLPPGNLSGFVTPFDTWADMSHLASLESWPKPPGSIAYFCTVLPEQEEPKSVAQVRATMHHFLQHHMPHLWPNLGEWLSRDDFFIGPNLPTMLDQAGKPDPLAAQYFRANQEGSERYVQSPPGSSRHRISPLDRTFDNLTIAGDWTNNGLNAGCVEAAVMSGMLASHAISGSPPLDKIVGYDHL